MAPLLGVLLGELVEPPAALEPVEPTPCSRRQRSFSVPIMLSQRMLLRPALGEVVLGEVVEELPPALGRDDEPGAPDVPLAEVPGPPRPVEDD